MTLDPEFIKYVQGIYGNANLDGRTIKLLYQVWQTNPQMIINTYNLKNRINPKTTSFALSANISIPTILKQEIANDDLRGISNFSDAFRIARQRGLKQFKWKNMVYGTKLKSETKSNKKESDKKQLKMINKGTSTLKKDMPKSEKIEAPNKYNYFTVPSSIYEGVKAPNKWNIFPNTAALDYDLPVKEITPNDRWNYWFSRSTFMPEFKSGGKITEQDAFTAYLIDKFKPKDAKSFEDTISKLTAKEINEFYKQFKTMKGQELTFAKLGAKLDYISKLNGNCPEGYEVEKFMAGGCVKCKKKKEMLNQSATDIFKASCGGSSKRRIKKKDKGGNVAPTDTVHTKRGIYNLTDKKLPYNKLTNSEYQKLSTRDKTKADLKDMQTGRASESPSYNKRFSKKN